MAESSLSLVRLLHFLFQVLVVHSAKEKCSALLGYARWAALLAITDLLQPSPQEKFITATLFVFQVSPSPGAPRLDPLPEGVGCRGWSLRAAGGLQQVRLWRLLLRHHREPRPLQGGWRKERSLSFCEKSKVKKNVTKKKFHSEPSNTTKQKKM